MSRENVKRVRESYEFVERTHEPDFELLHPDVEWHTRADLPDTGTRRGHDGAGKLLSEWFGAFDDLSLKIDELIDAGDRVIVVLRLHGCVRGSIQEVDMPETHVLTMRDGKTTEIHEYQTKAEALKAVGLAE
ncbi:MAG TPA: nuclear transport factor 2 family protein [Solirubrobacteraceae bacterium]|nr:nuclear transport factor 2 family protein [Solirubrobacteraceae bacterium]